MRLRGYVEGVGYRIVAAGDVAAALGLRVGDAVRLEAPGGSSGARVSSITKELKSAILATADLYMALGGRSRAVLMRRIDRAFEAAAVKIGISSDAPLSAEEVRGLISSISAARVPVFANFTGYFYTGRGWAKLIVKAVEPREPAYISTETRAELG